MKLNVIITSTRPERNGEPVGNWFFGHAKANPGGFDEVILSDLAEIDLPLLDEPHHPRAQKYTKDHTRKWAEIIDGSDAFVFVLPEYNFAPPPSFFNAVDYLALEWAYKPAGFVSYGGISGGMRSTQGAKEVLTTLKVVPLTEQVAVPMVFDHLKDGRFDAPQIVADSANTMIAELARWSKALATLR
ncbi:NADPH-dependent FMN reductase [Paracoccus aerodenitrificans]|uniref:NADPH-dependent FMN reductase n=1 Tax=Paracoccus aerodenitrificans TaxID=3017781 RepID=UPI0022F008DD|nr:NAD(P)H-dependent oxidoreductase [Paracoccus aerodenitrificans]WBU62998.1 NAD(P)H-dependent oxidoreductase [Paracoccus aerodenitrificans]